MGFQAAHIISNSHAAASRMARIMMRFLSLARGGSGMDAGGGVSGMRKVLPQWLHWWRSPWIWRWLGLWHCGHRMGRGMALGYFFRLPNQIA